MSYEEIYISSAAYNLALTLQPFRGKQGKQRSK
jgi:hypothetical protein